MSDHYFISYEQWISFVCNMFGVYWPWCWSVLAFSFLFYSMKSYTYVSVCVCARAQKCVCVKGPKYLFSRGLHFFGNKWMHLRYDVVPFSLKAAPLHLKGTEKLFLLWTQHSVRLLKQDTHTHTPDNTQHIWDTNHITLGLDINTGWAEHDHWGTEKPRLYT